MNINDILVVHDQQEPRVALVTNAVRRMLADFDALDALEYLPGKTVALKQARRGEAERQIVEELRRLEHARDEQTEADVAAAIEAERARLREHSDPVIDVHRLTVARSAAEVGAVLSEAQAISPQEARRVWPFALSRLQDLERAEFHRHVLPNSASASAVKLRWRDRVAGHGASTADEIRERARQDKAALRSRVLQIAELGGLSAAVHRATVRAAVPPAPAAKPTMQIGPGFKKFDALLRRAAVAGAKR